MSQRTEILRLLAAAILVTVLAGCQNQTAPTQSQTAGASTTDLSVSGVAREYGDGGEGRPVAHLRLKVRRASSSDGAVGSTPLDDVVTGADGRYTITGLSPMILFFQADPASDYRFPCDAYPVVVQRPPGGPPFPALTDLPVVRRSWSGNRPPNPWIIGTSVWGIVTERVNGVPEPVEGSTVFLESGLQDPPAMTTATGFYMICSVVGTDQERSVTASKDGYNMTRREYYGGYESMLNLELTRR